MGVRVRSVRSVRMIGGGLHQVRGREESGRVAAGIERRSGRRGEWCCLTIRWR